jgi:hypothetical protein
MSRKSRWQGSLIFCALAAASGGALTATKDAPEPPVVTKPIIGVITPQASGWAELGFVNVNKFPFDAQEGSVIKKPPLGPTSKTIFQSPDGAGTDLPSGQLIHLQYLPTFNSQVPKMGGKPHYHEFWEWGYTLKGDSIMPEPVSPYQANGMFYRKTQGGWLTRPPYSLHGGSWVTGAMRNQLPYDLIIFEEGDGHVINVGEPGQPGVYRGRDGKGPPPGTVGDWRQVKQFARPWLLDSTRDVDWEDDKEVPGRFVKWLDDDMGNGFRSQLVKIPPGWQAPPEWQKTYFENANRFRYMVWGSMKVWTFKNPQDAGKAYTVGEDYFIYQPPRAIWGYGPGPVTDEGAIWLEVTYAKGLKHNGAGPIEAVKRLN